MALHAGLVGVAQDDNRALRPIAGWHLAPATVDISDVIDRIIRDHSTTAPQPIHLFEASAELVALHDRIGSATLFDGGWRLLPAAERRQVTRDYNYLPITTIIDLADGRSIGGAWDHITETVHWVICRVEQIADQRFRLVDDPADIRVYGTSLALVLDAALDSGGDITHLETGRLSQLDKAHTA